MNDGYASVRNMDLTDEQEQCLHCQWYWPLMIAGQNRMALNSDKSQSKIVKRMRVRVERRPEEWYVPDTAETAHDRMETREKLERLAAAWTHLPQRERDVLFRSLAVVETETKLRRGHAGGDWQGIGHRPVHCFGHDSPWYRPSAGGDVRLRHIIWRNAQIIRKSLSKMTYPNCRYFGPIPAVFMGGELRRCTLLPISSGTPFGTTHRDPQRQPDFTGCGTDTSAKGGLGYGPVHSGKLSSGRKGGKRNGEH